MSKLSNAYHLVGKNRHGECYLSTLHKRLSFDRALDICNQQREAGDIFAFVYDRDNLMVCGVTPWDQTMEQDRAMMEEAEAFLKLGV